PPNRGGLNSTHFHGTAVPVEEPSTASKADSCTAASALSGMLAIRLRSGGRRPQQTDSQRALILVHSACHGADDSDLRQTARAAGPARPTPIPGRVLTRKSPALCPPAIRTLRRTRHSRPRERLRHRAP